MLGCAQSAVVPADDSGQTGDGVRDRKLPQEVDRCHQHQAVPQFQEPSSVLRDDVAPRREVHAAYEHQSERQKTVRQDSHRRQPPHQVLGILSNQTSDVD